MKAVILISGNGSNLQSIIDNADRIDLQISCVISNNKNAFGLKRAESAKLQTAIIDPELYNSKEAFDRELISIIQQHGVELIVLAGYMRVLTPLFVSHYFGKILNIHPSLTPKISRTQYTSKELLMPLRKLMGLVFTLLLKNWMVAL